MGIICYKSKHELPCNQSRIKVNYVFLVLIGFMLIYLFRNIKATVEKIFLLKFAKNKNKQ